MNRAISPREPNPLTQTCGILKNTLICLSCVVVVTGCGVTENIISRSTPSSSVQSLEVPPDLTTPQQTTSVSLFADTLKKLSEEEKAQYQQYHQFQRMAKYEEFLQWRKEHGGGEELTITDFRAEQSVLLKARLADKGVLMVNGDAGERIVLIAGTFDHSWERVQTALRNLGIQIGGTNRAESYFWFYYDTDDDQKPKGWLQWAFWMKKSPIYTLLLRSEDHGVSTTLYDGNMTPLTTPAAASLMQRLTVQLLTFAAAQQTEVAESSLDAPVLTALTDGRLQLSLPGTEDSAWRQLAPIIHDAGFTILTRDIQAHLFKIRYNSDKLNKKPALVQKLTFWKKPSATQNSQIFEIQLTGNGETTFVDVWDENEQRTVTGDTILKVLLDLLTN